MTYNFDPDLWYENQHALLEGLLRSGEISRQEYQTRITDLDLRYEAMWDRLDGTFELPEEREKRS